MARQKTFTPMALMDVGGDRQQWLRLKLPEAQKYECATMEEASEVISRLLSSGLEFKEYAIAAK